MTAPRPALLNLDGFSLRRLVPTDVDTVLKLHQTGANVHLIDLPNTTEGCLAFLRQLESQPWTQPMLSLREGEPVGVLSTGLTNLASLTTFLLAMFVDPTAATLPLALYVRHMFWQYPLQRVYAQFPLVDGIEAYADLYRSAGFQDEGVMRKHQVIGGRRYDVIVFGLLREDFDRWCAEHDQRLGL
jgi:hypothetical protein